jgi:Cytochrome P460
MKTYSIFILIIILVSCAKPVEPDTDPLTTSEINGETLWNRITLESDYNTYSFWPGHEEIQPGQSPHGSYHKIYINKELANILPVKEKIAPWGTVIVKENLNSEKNIDAITVMIKVKDYNPDGGDWFWAKYSPNGDILAEGKPKGCITCHSGMENNDYIIVRPLDLESGLDSNS